MNRWIRDPHPEPPMYRIASDELCDTPKIARLVPTPITSLRCAGGVCLDIARHLTGRARVVDMRGETVPEEDWRPALVAQRSGNGERERGGERSEVEA